MYPWRIKLTLVMDKFAKCVNGVRILPIAVRYIDVIFNVFNFLSSIYNKLPIYGNTDTILSISLSQTLHHIILQIYGFMTDFIPFVAYTSMMKKNIRFFHFMSTKYE